MWEGISGLSQAGMPQGMMGLFQQDECVALRGAAWRCASLCQSRGEREEWGEWVVRINC